jgi:hypothetical protein
MPSKYRTLFLRLATLIFLFPVWGQIANVWHLPATFETQIESTMRDPLYEVKDQDVVIHQGFFKNNGEGGNQTGGSVEYRIVPRNGTPGSWQSVSLGFGSDVDLNQYWNATIPSTGIDADVVIEYYVVTEFSDRATTYIYGPDIGGSSTTGDEGVAQSNPFSIRNRPGWIFYANNRIVSGNSIQVRLRSGYIGPENDSATRWSTHGAIYFTTDGSEPVGSLGVPSGTTDVVPLIADGVQPDGSGNGNAIWWQGTMVDVLEGMPFGDQVRYRIGLWHEDTEEEKFADHAAGPDNFVFNFQNGIPGNPHLVVNGINANYGVLNFYIDEIQDTEFPELDITLYPGTSASQVEVYTNLNNRDRAHLDYNNDGFEDGIIPVDGNTITVSDTGAYFQAYTMTPDDSPGTFRLTLPVNKTGAYRLTARFRDDENDPWTWLGGEGIRDLAIVVAPKIARDMIMYELHVPNSNATSDAFEDRGTFEDLHDPENDRITLKWMRDMGINWIWFQPFHPQGLDGKDIDPVTGQEFDPGSPYSIRNFWEINPLYTREWDDSLPGAITHPDNFDAAMQAFVDFSAAADQKGVYLMLDFPFNHTAPDVVLADKGIELFAPEGHDWQASDLIRDRVPGFFSTAGGNGPAYGAPAAHTGDIAVAPDRNDFGKWTDVRDVFFGNYATLVVGNPDAGTSRAVVQNEDDWMDYGSLLNSPDQVTINVWRYFGEVLPYWIEQSGHRGHNQPNPDWDLETWIAEDTRGIDGLRKDFGQGLPPQAMEYIINRTHSVKWNFVFMSESLDGGAVTYRSSRHFAVLNENIVFPLSEATTANAYRQIFEDRRNAYGLSLVLLNNLSHDERPYDDPWEALIRYATVSTNDGSPMIMYGQEIGAASLNESTGIGSWDHYELNFGKNIPHFKKWNSMQPQWNAWNANDFGVRFLRPVYAAIGQAREFSPALRSPNRWFLNRHSDDFVRDEIFSVAKYEQAGVPLAHQDVVLAFTNLDRDNPQSDTFAVPEALADLLGLANGRTYNVKNIAAYIGETGQFSGRRDEWLWGGGRDRNDIIDNGVFVSLNPVPGSNDPWTGANDTPLAPYEAQFLKVYDVTPPAAAESVSLATGLSYNATPELVMTVDTSSYDDHDNVVEYMIVIEDENSSWSYSTTVSGTNMFSWPVESDAFGREVTVSVTPVSVAGISGTQSTTSAVFTLLDPDGDEDNNGMTNFQEFIAGTDPFDAESVLRADNIALSGTNPQVSFKGMAGRRYRLEYSEDFMTGAAEPSWIPASSWVVATANDQVIDLEDVSEEITSRVYRIVVELN